MDAYKIAVHLAMTSNAPAFLSALSTQLLGVNAKVKDLEGSLNRIKVALAGGFMLAGGTALLKLFSDLADKGGEIVHQLELMKGVGMEIAEIRNAREFAFEVSRAVPNVSIADALRHQTELRYAFGDLETAQKYQIQLEKSNAILETVKPGSSDQIWELVKSLEQKGLTLKPDEFMSYVNTMTKVVQSSLGKVDPQQFFMAFKYGRTSMLGWDETFVGQYLPRLIQSMQGGGTGSSGTGGPGNALMSAFAKVVQGQMPKKAAQEFNRLGLADDFKDLKGSASAQIDVKGASLFTRNPYEWVQTILMPALTKAGITSQEAIIQEVSKLFPVRTASQIIGEMALQGRAREGAQSPFEKDAALQRKALGLNEAYGEYAKNDPVLVMKNFWGQWNSMLQAMGEAATPAKMEFIKTLTSMFQSVTTFANAHPEAIKILAEGIAALGVALVAGGAVAIMAALGPAGWLTAGIVALGAALAGLSQAIQAVDWAGLLGQVTSFFNGLIASIKSFIQSIPFIGGFFGGGGGLKKSSFVGPPPKAAAGDMRVDMHLDGDKVGSAVMRRQVAWATHPNSIGSQDTHGTYGHPGTWMPDAVGG